ncbi:MAG: hypothetical protein M1835_003379 [Candelina submexicana]|nr:MAG: hypothetical protein M1835_003379 [Candelina submexicana]
MANITAPHIDYSGFDDANRSILQRMFLPQFLWDTPFTVPAISLIIYICYGAIYRLYVSPIAKFPGPKLAALTFWYEFYYDVYKRGKYTWKLKELHQDFGPIIRINPFELHVNDPDFYDVLYCGPIQRRNKWEWSAKLFGTTTSAFATVDHDLHRQRRGVLSPYFSKKSVTQLEPVIQSIVDKLCAILKTYQESGEPVIMEYAYSALTADVISTYSFGKSYGCVAHGFAPDWYHMISEPSELSHSIKQFSWLLPLLQSFPLWFVKPTNPSVYNLLRINKVSVHLECQVVVGGLNVFQDFQNQIQEILNGKNYADTPHRTIFHEILTSDQPASEKSMLRMIHEAHTMISAGTITSAHMLKVTSYHIIANPSILKKLKVELQSVMPDPTTHDLRDTSAQRSIFGP